MFLKYPNFIDIDKIVVSDKIKHNGKGFKYDDKIIRPLCIVLPQMTGYIKYFDDGGKKCLLKLKMMTYF